MKGDFTRRTFSIKKDYRSVLMQQGRVQTDADWNEQQDILHHRIESETVDTLGSSAGPLGNTGFELIANDQNIIIGPGRYYVGGLACENPSETTAITQPNLPNMSSPVIAEGNIKLTLPPAGSHPLKKIQIYNSSNKLVNPASGVYIGYLEAWQRHISTLEDESIREVALGGPDTATREQILWQVKLLYVGDSSKEVDCDSELETWNDLTAPYDGRLAARSQPSTPPESPCLTSPEAGYRRLENQLYRVEIYKYEHETGKLFYKWSRDNGSIATKVTRWPSSAGDNDIEVADIGPDAYRTIAPGCHLEFYDDSYELLEHSGPLIKVLTTAGNVVSLDNGTDGEVELSSDRFPANPRVRRWDGKGEIILEDHTNGDAWAHLEDGIEIKFTPGRYRVGDYWLVPARTATGDVEWPQDNNEPIFQPPTGILRAYARLAILSYERGKWKKVADCRQSFPALTELTNLYYVGGDGQTAIPDLLVPIQESALLPEPLEVAVFNGSLPVNNAQVEFTTTSGSFDGGERSKIVTTNSDGIASVTWKVGVEAEHHRVTAKLLLDGNLDSHKYNQINFSAGLLTAARVAYDPSSCPSLERQEASTVQAAIDALCKSTHGSSCCTTVGEGGEFATLSQAFQKLIPDSKDIHICLLPGTHTIEDDINHKGGGAKSLFIHGAAQGTRLELKDQLFQLHEFTSIELRDFNIYGLGLDLTLVFEGCNSIHLSGLNICGITRPNSSLVIIRDSLRINLNGNLIKSVINRTLENSVQLISLNIEALKPLMASFNVKTGKLYQPTDKKIITELANLTPDAREKAVMQIESLLTDHGSSSFINTGAKRALKEIQEYMKTPHDMARLATTVETLRTSLAIVATGSALALDAPAAQTTLTGNTIHGQLCLYGASPSKVLLEETKLDQLSALLSHNVMEWDPEPGYLRLLNNSLTNIRLGGTFIENLNNATTEKSRITGCYSSLVANDNEWYGSYNEILAKNLALTLNALKVEGNFGNCIANQGKYFGNFADQEFKLFNSGNSSEASGNGHMMVEDL